MELLARYKNGNIDTTLFSDGTLIRRTEDDDFKPAFASNMDIKIIDRCDMGCAWCHEGSTKYGKFGDIMNEKFVDTLHPYQEVALGGGNVLEHPDLIPFLEKLKDLKVIANITLNQTHFMRNLGFVQRLVDEQLIWGLGISLTNLTPMFIDTVKAFPNAVVHVINGVITHEQIQLLMDAHLKVLILGYKHLRRGNDWYDAKESEVLKNQEILGSYLTQLMTACKVLSFDNLALEQLKVRGMLPDHVWERFYAGDDGSHTYYIDMVERKFAVSSTAPSDQRYALLDNVDEMFHVVQKMIRENKVANAA